MPHTFAYLMLVIIIMCLCVIIIENKKNYFFWIVICLFMIYISGARVPLLATGLLFIIVFDQIFSDRVRNIFSRILKILVIAAIGLFLFRDRISSSELMRKMITTSSNDNITSGRIYMWVYMWEQFINETNIFNFLLGQGDDKTYLYNLQNVMVNVNVWAHNDLVQTLIGKGIFGLFSYTASIIFFFRSLLTNRGGYYSYIFIGLIIVLVLFNGFYSYKDIALAVPYISLVNVYVLSSNDKKYPQNNVEE